MTDFIPVTKDENHERPVPSVWRKTFCDVVEAFRAGDFTLKRGIAGVMPITDAEAHCISDNIDGYGCSLARLSEETWKSSLCRWQVGYWEVLTDLFTTEESLSDLVIFFEVFEDCDTYRFEIVSVHVP